MYLVPDLDDELVYVLNQAEELLLTLRAWESDPDAPAVLPDPLAAGGALDALHRLQDAITPTQTRTTLAGQQLPATVGPALLLGPDGRYEHRPLRLVTLAQADLDLLAAATATMGHALAAAPAGELAEALGAGAEAACSLTYGSTPTPVDIVTGLTRALGVLDLAPDADTELLTSLLAVPPTAAVTLTPAADAAYARLADRINTMWADGSDLDRFGY